MCQAVSEQPFALQQSFQNDSFGACSSSCDPATETHSLDSSVEKSSSCDACPNCADFCENYSTCVRCQTKSRTRNNNAHDTYSPCQIRRHNTIDSAWVVAGTRIYDVTSYVQCHPAGERSILRKAGGAADVTRDLEFHSSRTRKTMRSLQVGRVVACGEAPENQEWWKFW